MSSGQLSFWANVSLGKYHLGQCLSGQMSFWANVFVGKCLSGQMSFWANVIWANVVWANVTMGKRRMDKCLWANVVWANVMEPCNTRATLYLSSKKPKSDHECSFFIHQIFLINYS
jgi:hypothetical protein